MVGTTQLSPFIGEVAEDSLAEKSGISVKDKILEIDQSSVEVFNDINLILLIG